MIVLLACAAPDLSPADAACTPLEWHEDRDGDGFPGEHVVRIACVGEDDQFTDASDCDDDDPAVFPGSDEVCNEVDDDCDGVIDADAPEAVTWCEDQDEDNHGGSEMVTACGLDLALPCDDCDDTDGDVSPSRWEECDEFGVDEDCDGLVNDESARTAGRWYRDADGDGYGDADNFVKACDAPPGHVYRIDDCVDQDSTIHPYAAEVCTDLVDQDCDERVDELCNEVQRDVDSADARFGHTQPSDTMFGDLVAPAGDVTGDGVPDLVLTAPGYESDANAWVFDGRAADDLDTDDAAAWFDLGVFATGVGDVDGDGAADVACGDTFSAHSIMLHRSPLAGAVASESAWSTLTAREFGFLVAPAGDLDGDGMDDIVGTSHGPDWPSAVYALTGLTAGSTDVSALPAFAGSAQSVAVLDDDGDGLVELYVLSLDLYVVDLPMAADVDPEDARRVALGLSDFVPGSYLASAGDWDGDGDDDLVAGSVVLGPTDSPEGTPDELVSLVSTWDGATAQGAAAGDFDGDGRTDVVIAAARASESGLAYGLLAPRTGAVDLAEADFLIAGEGISAVRDRTTVAVPGDTDGDGTDEVLIGTPNDPAWNGNSGAAWLFRGGDWVRP